MTSAARFVVPIRQALSSQRAPVTRQYMQRPCIRQWRGPARRTFSAKAALEVKKYTEDHEWVELDEGGKIGTIGITEYASNALGDVVYVELPESGMEVRQGDSIGAVESVKSASDILAPVSGKVVETNALLEEKPATINKGPEAEGWFAKIEITDVKELDSLMSKDDYDNFEKE